MSFHSAFCDELTKLAVNQNTAAWAFSRGVTSGAAAAVTGATMASVYNANKPKEQRTPVAKAALMSAGIAAMSGLGRGFAEKGLERKLLRAFKKNRQAKKVFRKSR